MRPDYLDLLDDDVRALFRQVERNAGVRIEFVDDEKLNFGGPTGQGMLRVRVDPLPVRIYVPTNGYFSNGALWHELSHVRRARIDSVPFITSVHGYADELDNAVEHLFIVPEEIARYPERISHWELDAQKFWEEKVPKMAENVLPEIDICVNWLFLHNVLPDSSMIRVARHFIDNHVNLKLKIGRISKEASDFLENGKKSELVYLLFDQFSEIAAVNELELEYKT
jgi:hypothetical protein